MRALDIRRFEDLGSCRDSRSDLGRPNSTRLTDSAMSALYRPYSSMATAARAQSLTVQSVSGSR